MLTGYVYPEEWAAYEAAIPEVERVDLVAAYGRRLRGELGEEEMRRAAKVTRSSLSFHHHILSRTIILYIYHW